MTEENNATMNNNEQCSVFSEQDKELANRAKQEYETEQYDGKHTRTTPRLTPLDVRLLPSFSLSQNSPEDRGIVPERYESSVQHRADRIRHVRFPNDRSLQEPSAENR